MSYTQRLSTSLGPGQAYIYSEQDPGPLPTTKAQAKVRSYVTEVKRVTKDRASSHS